MKSILTKTLVALAAGAVLVACGGPDVPEKASTTADEIPKTGGTNDMEGANAAAGRGGAKIVNEPPTDGIPPGGIVIVPKNPDDPKFKPAPGMAGGG